jgi:putative FmdB family regulatory protein
MPIYAYRCSACDFQKDVMQKVSEPLLVMCPRCSKETFVKQLAAPGFQLKGNGFYATDFKNDNKPTQEPVCSPCASAGSCPLAGNDS